MKQYEVVLEEAEEGGYVVTCPALPGCVSEGDSREDALTNIKDAIEGYLATLKDHGQPLPNVEAQTVEVAACSSIGDMKSRSDARGASI